MTMNLIIRPYRTGDGASIITLWRQCDLIVPQNDPYRDIQLKLQFQPSNRGGIKFYQRLDFKFGDVIRMGKRFDSISTSSHT